MSHRYRRGHQECKRKCKPDSKAKKAKFTFPGDKCSKRPDFVIAGAGTTSLPLAHKLSDQGYRVLMLEVGKDWENESIVQSPLIGSTFLEDGPVIGNTLNTIFDPRITSYAGNADGPGQGFRFFPFCTGRGIGGGGLHWLLTAVYPGDWILDGVNGNYDLPAGVVPPNNTSTYSFRQAGGDEWRAEVINKAIKDEIEGYRIGSSGAMSGFRDQLPTAATTECLALRGVNGPETIISPLPVDATALPSDSPQRMVQESMSEACVVVSGSAATPIVKDYNCTYNCVSQSQNLLSAFPGFPVGFTPDQIIRQNSASAWAYRDTVLNADGDRVGVNGRKLLIMANRPVVRAFEDSKRTKTNGLWTAGGVEFLHKNELFYVKGKNVIAGMGPTYSPQFWLRSGVGPAAELTEVGVDVKVDSPFVGKNLQNQYGGGVTFSVKTQNPSKYARLGVSFIQQNGIPRRIQNLNVALLNQNLQTGLVNPGAVLPVDPERNYFNLIGFSLTPRSRGYIKLASEDFGVQAVYHWNFFSDGSDPNVVASGIDDLDKDSDIWVACEQLDYNYEACVRLRNKIAVEYPSEDLRLVYPPESLWSDNPGTSDAERQARYRTMVPYLQLSATAAFHEAGTVTMNNDPAKGACDGNLKMHGTANCFTVDGSIMPIQALGNTGLLEQAIGINAGRLIPAVAQLY